MEYYKLFEASKLPPPSNINFSYFSNELFWGPPKNVKPPPGFQAHTIYSPSPVYYRPVYHYQPHIYRRPIIYVPVLHQAPYFSPMSSPMSSPRSDLSENAPPYSPR